MINPRRLIGAFVCFMTSIALLATNILPTMAADPTAILSVSPGSATKKAGEQLTVDFKLNTGGKSVTVIGVSVSYSKNLQFVSFNSTGSVFSTSVSDPAPQNNSFRFERARLDEGFNGADGKLLQAVFKVTGNGTGTITINKDSSEVLDAGDSSNILKSVSNGNYTIGSVSNSVATISPTPTTAKTTTTVASGTPSRAYSTIISQLTCAKPDGIDMTHILVTVNDQTGKVLTGDTYKPTVTADPAANITLETQAEGSSWLIMAKSTVSTYSTLTIQSKGVELGQRRIDFLADCSVIASPSPLPTVAKVPKSNPPSFLSSNFNLLIAALIFVILSFLIAWFIWRRRGSESAPTPPAASQVKPMPTAQPPIGSLASSGTPTPQPQAPVAPGPTNPNQPQKPS